MNRLGLHPHVRASLFAAVLLLAAVVASACQAASASGGGGPQKLTIKAQDTMRFAPDSVTVQAGQPVQLTLENDGALVHDFVLTQGVDQPVKVEANGKSSASTTFTITKPGTYTFACAQPGHEAAGMKGTIVAR